MNKEEFISELSKLNINISIEDLNKFEKYKELIKEYNNKFNLTSITKDEDIYLKHFYDSLYLLTQKEVLESKNILDIGVGAGLPSIPLAIMLKSTNITSVESNTKKCNFLNIVKQELNLSNIEIINERAEIYTKNNKNKFDIATSRAVAHLKVLSEIEVPALKVNGLFLPLKANIDEELKDTKGFIKELNANIEDVIEYKLPKENSKRTIIKIKKHSITDSKYPREYKIIIKNVKKSV